MSEPPVHKRGMSDHAMRDAYERALAARAPREASVDLPLERIEALVAGTGSEAERLRTLDMALSSADGRRELDVTWAAHRAARPEPRRTMTWRGLAVAATLVLAAGLGGIWARSTRVIATTDEGRETLRSGDSPLQLVSPRGATARAMREQFIWRRVPPSRDNAVRAYMAVVVDQTGTEVFSSSTGDTAITLPDSIRLAPNVEYLWWVQATMTDGTTLSAVTERIRVAPDASLPARPLRPR